MTEKENHILKEQSIKLKKDEKMGFNDSALKTIIKVKKKAFIVIIVVCFVLLTLVKKMTLSNNDSITTKVYSILSETENISELQTMTIPFNSIMKVELTNNEQESKEADDSITLDADDSITLDDDSITLDADDSITLDDNSIKLDDKTINDMKKYKYFTSYKGEVTFGIDFSDIQASNDFISNTLIVELPDVKILNTYVDPFSINTIYKNSKKETPEQELFERRKECEKDLADKVSKNDEIEKMAQESVKFTVENLLKPIITNIYSNYNILIKYKGVNNE